MDKHFLLDYVKFLIPVKTCNLEEHIIVHNAHLERLREC